MENAAQTLHRLTEYEPGREWTDPAPDPLIVQDLEVNDLDRLPWFYKRYSLPSVPLPTALPPSGASVLSVLSGTPAAPGDLDLAQLGRILYLSAGIVRTMQRPYALWPFRAAGSAGGRFPLELYVAIPAGHGDLPPGVHWYDPATHGLVRIGPPPTGDAPAIITTGVPWRTGWRYRERGYRHVYWDAGTMLSQLLAASASAGVTPELYTTYADLSVAALVGADGVHEWPVAVVSLGGSPALTASGPAAAGEVDAAPLEFPLVTAAQREGDDQALGTPWDFGAPVAIDDKDGRTVEDVILARGSTRRMDPTRGVPAGTLVTAMELALRGIDLPHFVAVHDVEAVPPGLYRWPDLTSPVRAGDLRGELYRVSLEQGLARDAAFVVIAATNVGTLSARGYRDAQLGSGLVEGRLHLLAYALGAGATGMTFQDSDIPALLGTQLDALIFTCVGVPDYKPSVGGRPGAPTEVRQVAPRE